RPARIDGQVAGDGAGVRLHVQHLAGVVVLQDFGPAARDEDGTQGDALQVHFDTIAVGLVQFGRLVRVDRDAVDLVPGACRLSYQQVGAGDRHQTEPAL